MNIPGAPGSEDRKKFMAVVGFAVVAAGVLYYELRDPNPPAAPVVVSAPAPAASSAASGSNDAAHAAAPAVVVSGPAAKSLGTTSAGLDPTLHFDAMRRTEAVSYEGTGRNIFSAISAPPPVVIPPPIAKARPQTVVAAPPVQQVVQRPCPPSCPPIDLKFFGTATLADGTRKAFLLHGEDNWLASAGDIVMRRYRIVSISDKSVEVEDMQTTSKQTLPLLAN